MALELERRGIEHPGLAGRDLAVVLNGVEVEAGADPLVAMIEPRPAGADHLERARRRREPAATANVEVAEEDESARDIRKCAAQRARVHEPAPELLEAQARVDRIVVDQDHRKTARDLRVREGRPERVELSATHIPGGNEPRTALESAMNAAGPRSFTQGKRPAGRSPPWPAGSRSSCEPVTSTYTCTRRWNTSTRTSTTTTTATSTLTRSPSHTPIRTRTRRFCTITPTCRTCITGTATEFGNAAHPTPVGTSATARRHACSVGRASGRARRTGATLPPCLLLLWQR